MRAIKWRTLLRSYSSSLQSSSSTWQILRHCSTSAPAVQLPESSRERVLQLVDHYQSNCKPSPQFSKSLDLVRTWALDNKEPPHPKGLEILFSMCFKSGLTSDVEIALSYAESHGVALNEGQTSAMLSAIAKSGDYAKTKQICKRMEDSGVDLRLTALCVMLQRAATERDFPYLLALSKQLSRHKAALHNLSLFGETLSHVFRATAGDENPIVQEVGRVLVDTFRITRRKLSREMASEMSEWFNSFPRQYSVQSTVTNHSGECSGCGLALDPGDITHEELQLLRQHIDHTLQNMVDQSVNAKQEQTKLHVLRAIVEKNNFGAILDGLNIARVFQRQSPSRKQLLQVAAEAANITGKPVLALMRKHCSRWFTTNRDSAQTIAEIADTYRHLGLHCFFTNNYDEDDLYLLYATLFSEPSTFLVTNDLQGCNKQRLPEVCRDAFDQWQRRRLANVMKVGGKTKIKFPLVYDDAVQWSPRGSGPRWENLHMPLKYHHRWLCVRQLDLTANLQHDKEQTNKKIM